MIRIIDKIRRKWVKLRLRPIHVFDLHHVCEHFDTTSMCEGDWMEIGVFQSKVLQMQQSGVEFISLADAHRIISNLQSVFSIRFKRYAVLTFDDGYKSLDEILPWLIELKIPVTLFINGKYTDGISQRQVEGKHFTYLTKNELQHYVEISDGLISLQSHGYEHFDATGMSLDTFREQIEKNMSLLTSVRLLPIMGETGEGAFHAYTWGQHNAQTDAILRENNIIPVYVDGMKNYNDASCIHRELLN